MSAGSPNFRSAHDTDQDDRVEERAKKRTPVRAAESTSRADDAYGSPQGLSTRKAAERHPALIRLTPCSLCNILIGFRRPRFLCLHCRCELCSYCVINEGGVGPWCGECPLPLHAELPPSPTRARGSSGVGTIGGNSPPGYPATTRGSGRMINTAQRVIEGANACYICRAKYGLLTWKRQCDDCHRFTCDSCSKKMKGTFESGGRSGSTMKLCLACYKIRSNDISLRNTTKSLEDPANGIENMGNNGASPTNAVKHGDDVGVVRAVHDVDDEDEANNSLSCRRDLSGEMTDASPSPSQPHVDPVLGAGGAPMRPSTLSESPNTRTSSPPQYHEPPHHTRDAASIGRPNASHGQDPSPAKRPPVTLLHDNNASPPPGQVVVSAVPLLGGGSGSHSTAATPWEERVASRSAHRFVTDPTSCSGHAVSTIPVHQDGSLSNNSSFASNASFSRPATTHVAGGGGGGARTRRSSVQRELLDHMEAVAGEDDEAFARRLATQMHVTEQEA